jgi:hypothetical protein
MRRLPFSIRELMIFTLVVALSLSLWYERSRYTAARTQLDDLLQSPHVWVWAPTLQEKIPIGGSVGVAGQLYYSDKERFVQPITATIRMIEAASQKTIAEVADVETVGVPGRRSFAGNFKSSLYGKQIQPGIYIFLVKLYDGDKEVGRGSTAVEFYHFQNSPNNGVNPSPQ